MFSAGLVSSAAQADDWRDFLIQNVCLDKSGNVTDADPALKDPEKCASQRDLKPEEPLPYRRTDFDLVKAGSDTRNNHYLFFDSLPLINGLALTTMNHEQNNTTAAVVESLKGKWNANFNPFGHNVFKLDDTISKARTGEGGSERWVSAIATKDANTPDPSNSQYFAGNGCKPEKSWLLFPENVDSLTSDRVGVDWAVNYLSNGSDMSSCYEKLYIQGRHFAKRKIFTYVTNRTAALPRKALDTIITEHWAARDYNGQPQVAMEILYFTKEYGLTRWEAWGIGDTPSVSGNILCGNENNVRERDFNFLKGYLSQTDLKLVRKGCRDLTRVVPTSVSKSKPHPQELYTLNAFPKFRTNLIYNGDFFKDIKEVVPATAESIWSEKNWIRTYEPANILDWEQIKDEYNNRWLSFSCRNSCMGSVKGQSFNIGLHYNILLPQTSQGGEEIDVGAIFRSYKPVLEDRTLSIGLAQYNDNKKLIPESPSYFNIAIPSDAAQRATFKQSVSLLPGARWVRFILFPKDKEAYLMTMPYATLPHRQE